MSYPVAACRNKGSCPGKVFKFDPALSTFTPKMAKRATSIFAASPIVQGKWDNSGAGDILSAGLGNGILTGFFQNFDIAQGAVSFWVTPEWNGNDNFRHTILMLDNAVGTDTKFYIIKHVNNTIDVRTGAGSWATGVSTATWVAGTTYHIVLRWDSKNPLDGTNFCSISVNDTHTFGLTSLALQSLPSSHAMYFGVNSGSVNSFPANAIIQGLTIYRRPLFDGAYGVDMGNGDEINLIYNSGTGQDPTLVTGAQDVVFCLPTNATAGELATGTGNAWSFPHSSNILKHGWMEDRFYGGGAWAIGVSGSSGSYINCGKNASINNLGSGAIFQVEGWARIDDSSTEFMVAVKGYHTTGAGGWDLFGNAAGNISFGISLATTCAKANGPGDGKDDGKWHHFVGHYNDTTKIARLAVDGIWGADSTPGVGNYVADTNNNLEFGSRNGGAIGLNKGNYGWWRIHNHAHYTPGTNFVPPRTLPAPDANTVEQWAMNEGTGTVATATVNVANNGTISNGTWESQWVANGTPVEPKSLEFNGSSTLVTVPKSASINNLPAGAFTAETWFRANPKGVWGLFQKSNSNNRWFFNVHDTAGFWASIPTDGTGASLVVGSPTAVFNKKWHHVAITFDNLGDRKVRMWFDGILLGVSPAATGTVLDDSAFDLLLGRYATTNYYNGSRSWSRISNSIRYTSNFIPAPRSNPPAVDANTVLQYNVTEGAGMTLTDLSGNGNNGTITNGIWNNTPAMEVDSPGARIYGWGEVWGSDAVDEGIKQTLGITGANIVPDGTFDNTTGWTRPTGWSVVGGVAHCDGSQTGNSELFRTLASMVDGQYYKLTYTLLNYVAGILTPHLGTAVNGTPQSANGTFVQIIKCTGNTTLYFRADADFIGDIDNVAVEHVDFAAGADFYLRALAYSEDGVATPYVRVYDETNGAEITRLNGEWARERCANGGFDSDTLWTKGPGWTIAGGVAHCDGSQVASCNISERSSANQQNGGLVVGRLYKITYTVLNYVAGAVNSAIGTGLGTTGVVHSANGTYSDIIRCQGTPNIYISCDADFVGDIDNVSVIPVSEEQMPDHFILSFELPTVARGAAADCTSFSVQLLNAGTGVVGWHQVELLPNLLDNPSFETGAGDPWIPYGWSNNDLDAGDTQEEVGIFHSGGKSLRFNISATNNEKIELQSAGATNGGFYAYGGWIYGSGVNSAFITTLTQLVKQTTASTAISVNSPPAYWSRKGGVARNTATSTNFRVMGQSVVSYTDDMYLLKMDDVSLTATPASLANSTENGGIRVDGYDKLTQPVPAGMLKADKGKLRFSITPRHANAIMGNFGVSVPALLEISSGNSNNYLQVYKVAGNFVLDGKANGVAIYGAGAMPVLVAGTTYPIEVAYTPSGVTLSVNGTVVATAVVAINFTILPILVYFGSFSSGSAQFDIVFSAP